METTVPHPEGPPAAATRSAGEPSRAGGAVSPGSASRQIVGYFEAEVRRLPGIEHFLDDGTFSETRLRREIQAGLVDAHLGLAAASGCQAAIETAEAAGIDPVEYLHRGDAAVAAVRHWGSRWRAGAESVALDLKIISSLIGRTLEPSPQGLDERRVTDELVKNLVDQAAITLERSIPPDLATPSDP